MPDLNKLIGIPFKLNRGDFSGCDCRGIVCLYFQHIKNKIIPFTDGGPIRFRNKKNDVSRITKILLTFCKQVNFEELRKDDIVILKVGEIGALGVCVNDSQVLHMHKSIGSCLTKIYQLKTLFLFGFRLNE